MNINDQFISSKEYSEESEFMNKSMLSLVFNSIVHPQKVIRYITNINSPKFFHKLVMILGVQTGLSFFNLSNSTLNIVNIIIFILIGIMVMYSSIIFDGAILKIFGRLFKGKASTKELKVSSLWSNNIKIVLMPIIIICLSVNQHLFPKLYAIVTHNILLALLYIILSLIIVMSNLWIMVIRVLMVSEVQQISRWKALLNIILPIITVLIPLIIIVMLSGDIPKWSV